jgi:PleD family two-component response regulator
VSTNKQKKILIVEDDLDLGEMLGAYFRVQGYQVRSADWGEDAVRLALEDVPDIVVLDIRLPDIDGFEVCRRLRQNRPTKDVPVIFLTEKRERDDKLSGLELGAVDYITKPFDIQELRLRVRNILRRFKQSTLVNPITGLPEGELVMERLEQMLQRPKWGLVMAGIRGLSKFRDQYGFVAADDVARAISLMLTNAMQESGAEDDFIGHIDLADFVIITAADNCRKLTENCLMRLQPSIQYFYPTLDRGNIHKLAETERLSVQVITLSSRDGSYTTVQDLRAALAKAPAKGGE